MSSNPTVILFQNGVSAREHLSTDGLSMRNINMSCFCVSARRRTVFDEIRNQVSVSHVGAGSVFWRGKHSSTEEGGFRRTTG